MKNRCHNGLIPNKYRFNLELPSKRNTLYLREVLDNDFDLDITDDNTVMIPFHKNFSKKKITNENYRRKSCA